MSRIGKLLERLLSRLADFTWDELIRILNYYGYDELKSGKTGGSRRKYANNMNQIINLHKPHPGNILKRYAIDQVISTLKERGHLKDE